jgi:Transcriptional regulator
MNGGSLMQYLKEDVKERITKAALQEFKEKGYLDSSIRNIARNAGVAIGNVYRYFESKEDLFNEIIEPVYDKLMRYVFNLKKSSDSYISPIGEITDIKDKIIDIFKENSTELLILMDKSKGSKYENIKEDTILLVDSILKEKLLPQLKEKGIVVRDDFITYVLASTLVDGVYIILRNHDDGLRISYLIDQMINIYFTDIDQRIR